MEWTFILLIAIGHWEWDQLIHIFSVVIVVVVNYQSITNVMFFIILLFKQNDFDSIRPLCYKNTDVFLVCFSVVSPTSFGNIAQKWLPEIRRSLQEMNKINGGSTKNCAIPPFVLVGTQCDLRHDVKVLIELDSTGQQPISSDYARSMATKLGAMCYIECSALTQKNLKVCTIRRIIVDL